MLKHYLIPSSRVPRRKLCQCSCFIYLQKKLNSHTSADNHATHLLLGNSSPCEHDPASLEDKSRGLAFSLFTSPRSTLEHAFVFATARHDLFDAKKKMHTSARSVTLKWQKTPQGTGSILRPHPRNKPPGFYVAYKDGLIKYSKKPIIARTAYNDYGTLLRDGKVRRPRSDLDVVDTRRLIQ